jgi:hypothetical protein
VFTGLRPGEKLQEKLYYDAETVRGTEVPKIWRVLDPQPPPDVRRVVGRLLSVADGDREAKLRQALFEAVAIRDRAALSEGPEQDAVVSIPPLPRVDRAELTVDLTVGDLPVEQLALPSDDPDDELETAGAPGPGSPG